MYETNTGSPSAAGGAGSASPPVEPGRSATGTALKQSAGEAKAEVKDLAQQAQAQARDLAHQAQSQAKDYVESQKGVVADTLAGVARALDSTAKNLEGEQQVGLSGYAKNVASSIESFSSNLRDKDLQAIRGDAERFARAKPALFIGGCVALGFAISRFLKASSKPSVPSVSESLADDTSISNEPGFSYHQSTPSQESWDEPMGTSGVADEFGVTSDASGAGASSSLTNAGDISETSFPSNYTTPWSGGVKR